MFKAKRQTGKGARREMREAEERSEHTRGRGEKREVSTPEAAERKEHTEKKKE
jgi:hypothetical protein